MNPSRQIILNSLRFHARGHVATVAGIAVATAVLVGALVVGDSVRQSLIDLNLARLGKIRFAFSSQERFFRAELAQEIRKAAPEDLTASTLQLRGTASNPEKSARANHVQVLGVDETFWALAQKAPALTRETNSVILNQPLADQLGVKIGDTVLVRVQKMALISSEAPLAPREDVTTALRLQVGAIVADSEFGRFSLQASQITPMTAFVPLHLLQERLELKSKANLLLTSGLKTSGILKQNWTLADAGLELRSCPGGVELRSERVFLDRPVVEAALRLAPHAQLISTYFVNELRVGDRTTPYSMVSAVTDSFLQSDVRDDEILVNSWLADDLGAKTNDTLRLKWLRLNGGRLETQESSFRVRAILPLQGAAADRTLMPDFPGLAKAEKTENWDAGFKIDMAKIRPKDEQYWKDYRGTPKAFVSLQAGKRMWGNRFGDITAIRFPNSFTQDQIVASILGNVDPGTLGFSFQPVREQALAAASQSQDFGDLFLGLSFFLIAAALILVGLLFQFGLEKRATETGILLAIGLSPGQVRRLMLFEGLGLALIGSAFGAGFGIGYAEAILFGLKTVWRDAVGTSALSLYLNPAVISIGVLSSVVLAACVIFIGLHHLSKKPARELLERGKELEGRSDTDRERRWDIWVLAASGLIGLGLVVCALISPSEGAPVGTFFGAGAAFLTAGLAGAAMRLRHQSAARLGLRAADGSQVPLTLKALALRACARRPRRSLATTALLAGGAFLIVAVEINKLDATRNPTERSSGTGGFSYIAQSALPVVHDLNSDTGREFYALSANQLAGAEIVPMRLRDGDDASCLNLNRAQTPRLLGVDPELLNSRNAFTFSRLADSAYRAKPWTILNSQSKDEVPAIADEASILWALGKKVGDTLDFIDERGSRFKVRLVGSVANSILQGSLVISETAFMERFPGISGHRMFLIDVPGTSEEKTRFATTLSGALQDVGLEITPTVARLNALNAVQNTYLNTFQILGALGLLLGSAGLGMVVLRNVLERRGELALLMAVGFHARTLHWLILFEHASLLCMGLLIGSSAALVAVLPALTSPGTASSLATLATALMLILVSGLAAAWIGARIALRGNLLEALRND